MHNGAPFIQWHSTNLSVSMAHHRLESWSECEPFARAFVYVDSPASTSTMELSEMLLMFWFCDTKSKFSVWHRDSTRLKSINWIRTYNLILLLESTLHWNVVVFVYFVRMHFSHECVCVLTLQRCPSADEIRGEIAFHGRLRFVVTVM